MHARENCGGGEIRTHEAVRLWFSRPVQLSTMRHLLDQTLLPGVTILPDFPLPLKHRLDV
jgi:hypothetical protein